MGARPNPTDPPHNRSNFSESLHAIFAPKILKIAPKLLHLCMLQPAMLGVLASPGLEESVISVDHACLMTSCPQVPKMGISYPFKRICFVRAGGCFVGGEGWKGMGLGYFTLELSGSVSHGLATLLKLMGGGGAVSL